MAALLQEEWPRLLAEWEKPPYLGLRVNTLKISVEDFLSRVPFELSPVPWCREGFYLTGENRPGKHPYYQAGLFYLQEPSAMAPAACLGVAPGDRVLDLCAAPGGKSTQLATLLQGQGLLVSNDNSAERIKTLVWNLEHWGAPNVTVTNEEPGKLAACFPQYFDKILVDAPCSGEGMFRRDPNAVRSWEEYSRITPPLQRDILEQAALMLRPGGKLLYSTCTFSPEENEEMIALFLEQHPQFSLAELPLDYGWQSGRPDWVKNGANPAGMEKTRRLWPHLVRGEGHFLALLEKEEPERDDIQRSRRDAPAINTNRTDVGLKPFYEFMEENLTKPLSGKHLLQGPYLYACPEELPALTGLRAARPGWFVGMIRENRFEPSQALAMGLKPDDAIRRVALSPEESKVYLKGETLMLEGKKGWTLVCLEEFPLGWGKQTGGFIKNNYPSAWRLME
jgi:NOL1/NOP2/sun family putative RNA methylase